MRRGGLTQARELVETAPAADRGSAVRIESLGPRRNSIEQVIDAAYAIHYYPLWLKDSFGYRVTTQPRSPTKPDQR
jgi:hypothetical protein